MFSGYSVRYTSPRFNLIPDWREPVCTDRRIDTLNAEEEPENADYPKYQYIDMFAFAPAAAFVADSAGQSFREFPPDGSPASPA